MPVEDGQLAGRPRIRDRQLPSRAELPDERVRDRVGALLAGEPREQHRGATLVQRRRAVWPAGDEHQHDRGARLEHGSDELLLHAGQVERRTVAGLAARAVVGQAGLVAHDQHRHVCLPREGNRLCEAVACTALDVAAPRVPHPRPQPSAEGVEHRRRADVERRRRGRVACLACERIAAAVEQHPQRLDVRGVRVVAEQVAGIGGGRADHGHGADRGRERQGAVVPEEDEALARRRAGERCAAQACCSSQLPRWIWTYGVSNSPSWNFDRSTRRTAVSTVASLTTPPFTASSSGVP